MLKPIPLTLQSCRCFENYFKEVNENEIRETKNSQKLPDEECEPFIGKKICEVCVAGGVLLGAGGVLLVAGGPGECCWGAGGVLPEECCRGSVAGGVLPGEGGRGEGEGVCDTRVYLGNLDVSWNCIVENPVFVVGHSKFYQSNNQLVDNYIYLVYHQFDKLITN